MQRLQGAMNAHDIDAFVACFDPGYVSEQPAHPDRAFVGADQVRKNWSSLFASLPDLRAELRTVSEDGDLAWSEWHWTATQSDDSPFDWRGVILAGVKAGRIAWARLYMEPTELVGSDIDATVREMTSIRESER
jgi:ketosteroid isomerase-like protein